MLTITIKVNAPSGKAIGIKEAVTMRLEDLGDCRVVEIRKILPEQMRMEEEHGYIGNLPVLRGG